MVDQNQPNFHIWKAGPEFSVALDDRIFLWPHNANMTTQLGWEQVFIYFQNIPPPSA